MKLVLGGDLHGHLPDVPSCDVLVLAGDILPDIDQGIFIERQLGQWLERVPSRATIATWGNHDSEPFRRWHHNFRWHLLIDQSINVCGLKFHGTPWCLPIGRWAWQAPEYLLEKVYELIPEDTDILVSHSPPFEMCDLAVKSDWTGSRAGSRALKARMAKLPNLKYLVCGHIHEGRGRNGKVLNVSCLDERYRLRPDPWVIIDI